MKKKNREAVGKGVESEMEAPGTQRFKNISP